MNTLANPIVAHLTAEDIETIGVELDALRDKILRSRGEHDAQYIHCIVRTQRLMETAARALLIFSNRRSVWWTGTLLLAAAKSLENMEIGHNVLHGQWDWMNDPEIHSTTWEWDHVSPASTWQQSHNVTHHTYTNILGKDNDLGYGIMRVDERQPWHPVHLAQPVWNFITACVFEYGIAAYDLDLGHRLRTGDVRSPAFRANLRKTLGKVKRQALKDYVIHPALATVANSGPDALRANLVANVLRNVWSHSVIMCGHFPEGVQAFEQESIKVDETRGAWYLRQMLGSANIAGSPLMHIATGNLSHQIEHHLFPDLPSNRYAEIAPQVRALFQRYNLRYHSASLPRQVYSAWHRVFRLSLPNQLQKG